MLARPVRPAKRGSRRSPESRRLDTAITTLSARRRPLSTGRQSCWKRRFRVTPRASRPSRHGHLRKCRYSTRRRARLPPPGPRTPARARVGHGSHTVVSNQTQRTPVRSKRRTGPATITHSSSRMEETRTLLRSPSSPIGRADGHGGDRPPRQLETGCSRDCDRLFRLPADTGYLSCARPDPAPCSQQNLGLQRISNARLPVDDLGRSVDQRVASATAKFGFSTSLPTIKHSAPSRHEPTLPFSEWNPAHCATTRRRTTPSRDTEIWLKSKHEGGGEHTAQYNVALQRIAMLLASSSQECLEARTKESTMCAMFSRFSPSLKHASRSPTCMPPAQ